MLYGHRRDVLGYGRALEESDRWLGGFLPAVEPPDLVIATADHGKDIRDRGTDHTREQKLLLVLDRNEAGDRGTQATFADIPASLAQFFQLPNTCSTGSSFLKS